MLVGQRSNNRYIWYKLFLFKPLLLINSLALGRLNFSISHSYGTNSKHSHTQQLWQGILYTTSYKVKPHYVSNRIPFLYNLKRLHAPKKTFLLAIATQTLFSISSIFKKICILLLIYALLEDLWICFVYFICWNKMNAKIIRKLPKSVISLICASNQINTYTKAVKELVS